MFRFRTWLQSYVQPKKTIHMQTNTLTHCCTNTATLVSGHMPALFKLGGRKCHTCILCQADRGVHLGLVGTQPGKTAVFSKR